MPLCRMVGARYNKVLNRLPTLTPYLKNYTGLTVDKLPGMKSIAIRDSTHKIYSKLFNKFMELILREVASGNCSFYFESSDDKQLWARMGVEWIEPGEKYYKMMVYQIYRTLNVKITEGRLPILRITLKDGRKYDLISFNLTRVLAHNSNTKNAKFSGVPSEDADYMEQLKGIYPGFTDKTYKRIIAAVTNLFISRLQTGKETNLLGSSSIFGTVHVVDSNRRNWSSNRSYIDPITTAIKERRKINFKLHGKKY